MNRVYHTFPVNDINIIKQQMLTWANSFNICCFLDNNQYSSAYHSFECMVGAGAVSIFETSPGFFPSLSSFIHLHNDWIFGHFNYDIKNEIEPSGESNKTSTVNFPDYFLFVPEVVLQLTGKNLIIGVINRNANDVYNEITRATSHTTDLSPLQFVPLISRQQYLDTVSKLLGHIKKGDCYEINFCQEFIAEGYIDTISAYRQLNNLSPNPFSAYYKLHNKFLLCASPERYIRKEGSKIISQPIKGTVNRNLLSASLDNMNKHQLRQSKKDRSENVMVVDLVRNDLSKICNEGTVVVDELFGVYTFPNLHHMISTVSGHAGSEVDFPSVLKATFPMGSMTGAPKKKVMELIDKYEQSKRGIYSGTVGYISPAKDFDFNVVIRSLVYNAATLQLSFHVGSAITCYSDPQKEYEECLLKGEAMLKLFET